MNTPTHKSNKIQLKCQKGQLVTDICINQKCDHNAYCCKQLNCCQQPIKNKCNLIKLQELLKINQINCNRFDTIYNLIMQFFKSVIKIIQNQINYFQDWSEKQFIIRKMFNKCYHQIPLASDLAKAMDDIKQYNQYLQDVSAYIKTWDKHLHEQFSQIRSILCQKNHKKLSIQPKAISKASKSSQQLNKNYNQLSKFIIKQHLQDYFYDIINSLKDVLTINLLYHASDNQFSIHKFHDLCDGIPNTLVLIKNDKDHIYGGYTPLPWGKSKFEKYLPDDQLQTFVFSLTHQKKYCINQKQKRFAIEWNSLFGPLFGRCNIIQIWDNANKQSSYWEHIPFTFKPPHGEWTNEMYEQMLGAAKYQHFKLLEWDVFQVIFH